MSSNKNNMNLVMFYKADLMFFEAIKSFQINSTVRDVN